MNKFRQWSLLTVALTFIFAAVIPPGHSQDTNDGTAPEQKTQERRHILHIESGKGEPLPKEYTDKLSAEQLHELLMTREANRAAQPPEGIIPISLLVVFGTPVVIVLLVLIYRFRKNRQLHQTIALMLEKGAPIPPELIAPEKQRPSDLRRGIILIAVGLGIVVFFLAQKDEAWGIGAIPLLIGAGYLIAWKLEQKKQTP